jgi:hypothetical protein
MLESYLPIYQLALDLEALRTEAKFWMGSKTRDIYESDANTFQALLRSIQQKCSDCGFTHTADLAKRLIDRSPPATYALIVSALDHLNDSLTHELEQEAVFRISPERKDYFEQTDLFGSKVAVAFPSCTRDSTAATNAVVFQRAGSRPHQAWKKRSMGTPFGRFCFWASHQDRPLLFSNWATRGRNRPVPHGRSMN